MAAIAVATPEAPNVSPVKMATCGAARTSSRKTIRISAELPIVLTRTWPTSSAAMAATRGFEARPRPRKAKPVPRLPVGDLLIRLSFTSSKTGTPASRNIPALRKKTLRSPKAETPRLPSTGPAAPATATAELKTPTAQPTWSRGVSIATIAIPTG
jgi:hypothetical protein